MSDKLLEAITACLNDPAFQSGSMNEVFRVVPSRLWEAIEDAYMVAKAESAAQQAVIKAAMRVVDCAEEVSTPDPDGPCVFEVGVLLMLELRSAIARYRAALTALDGGDPHGD